MDRDDDFLRLRDELTRRFDLVLRPSADEIVRFRDAVMRLAAGDRDAAERAAARQIFLMQAETSVDRQIPGLRSAA